MFRLVSLQLEQLWDCDGRESEVAKALSDVPSSLESIYDRILQNITNPDMLSTVCRAINWLIFATRPMELDEIIDALAVDFNKEPLRFYPGDRMRPKVLLAACAGLVTVSDTTLKLAHASVKEYFLMPTRAKDFYSDVSEAHRLISQTCISYLCSFDDVLNDTDLRRYPLALYAANYWAFHVERCTEIRPNKLIDTVLELLQADSPHYQSLCRLNDIDDMYRQWRKPGIRKSAPILPPLYLAAFTGIFQVVAALIERGADVNEQAGRYGNILQIAAREGHTEIVRLLIEHGANVNTQGGESGNALQAASRQGHIQVARLLIDRGADVNAQGGEYANALQAASGEGHTDIVRLLLDRGANVNARGGEYATALQAAARGGRTDVVRLLLERGADVNAEGGVNGGALHAASYANNRAIIDLLSKHGAVWNAQADFRPSPGSLSQRPTDYLAASKFLATSEVASMLSASSFTLSMPSRSRKKRIP
ncbi:ankyrin repeat-containing domain protein [Mycena olivaceomarginata]|nr:ankyrin repeat-containing domain protein [Mycena olivaceomarginata]